MNLVEFLFAFGAVIGMTSVHMLWARLVYKLENSKPIEHDFNENKVT